MNLSIKFIHIRPRFIACSILLLPAAFLLCLRYACADDVRSIEYRVKAGFIYKFALYTEWPAHAFQDDAAPLIMCVPDTQEMRDAFETIQAKKVNGRQVHVIYLRNGTMPPACHVLFFDASQDDREIAHILAATAPTGVLTVGESPDFCKRGGIIKLYKESKRIRFEINPAAAKRSQLKLSAHLMKLAKIYTEKMQ